MDEMTNREARTILGIAAGASKEEIKRRFRILSHDSHPDKGGSEKEFISLNIAYQTLMNHHIKDISDTEAAKIEKIILGFEVEDDDPHQSEETEEW